MRRSEQCNELYAALALARAGFGTAKRTETAKINSDKGSYSYSYAPLEECFGAIDKALAEHGLALVGGTEYSEDGRLLVVTHLGHQSGQWIENVLDCGIPKSIKDLGGLLTYARRYGVMLTVQIQGEDDDDGPHDGSDGEITKSQARPRRPSSAEQGRRADHQPAPAGASQEPSVPAQAPQPAMTSGSTDSSSTSANGSTSTADDAGEGVPPDKLTRQQAIFRIQTRTRDLHPGNDDTAKQDRIDLWTSVFGTAIDGWSKITQLPLSALRQGAAKLMAMQPEQPPAVPPDALPPGSDSPAPSSTASSAAPGAVGASEEDVPHHPPPEASTTGDPDKITMPDAPRIVDGYVSEEDVLILMNWARMMEQLECFLELTTACPKEHGLLLITPRLWERIINAVHYRVEHQAPVKA